jgi:hypothetical protein
MYTKRKEIWKQSCCREKERRTLNRERYGKDLLYIGRKKDRRIGKLKEK